MLRGFLIFWLLISQLGYGMAVLADLHSEAMPDSETHLLHHSITHDADHQDTDSDCDHCCHGLTHLLGLISSDTISRSVMLTEPPIGYAAIATDPPPLVLFRPPIRV